MIANARMYSVDAASAAAWRALLEWVLHRAGVEGEVVDHPSPLPLEALWSRPDLGCAFMCGYPFARATPQPIPLAALVPSPERYRGKPVYWTDLVVRDDAPLHTIADAFGRVMAYTTEGSQSGYQAPRRFLAPYAKGRGGSLFASMIGPLITPRQVAEAIVTGAADIGPLDSYAHDLLRQNDPGLASRLRTIASTPPMPIPPLVAAPTIDSGDAKRLREALYAAGCASELQAVRRTLLIERFVPADARTYAVLVDEAAEADRLGYPRLA
jgi:ABC-type phosphate/phosphonate transport system substrate-binding protein